MAARPLARSLARHGSIRRKSPLQAEYEANIRSGAAAALDLPDSSSDNSTVKGTQEAMVLKVGGVERKCWVCPWPNTYAPALSRLRSLSTLHLNE